MKKLSSFIPILAIVFAIFTGNIALSASYSQELQEAYDFAYKNKITTQNSIDKADMNGGLTRIAMAKMLSQYAINILGKSPDTSKIPNFGDVNSKLDGDYNNGVTLAYQLGIMGVGIDKFRPFDSVTRAEFGTALSRVLYGNKYEGGSQYYTNHLNALKSAGIMNQINKPNQGEIRGYVMLMLMRSNKDTVIGSNIENTVSSENMVGGENMVIIEKPTIINIGKDEDSDRVLVVSYSDGTLLKSLNYSNNYRIIKHEYGTVTDFENYCRVEFRDYDGTILKNDEVYGEGTKFSAINKPKNPTRSSDKNCTYTFSGWTNALTISGKYNNESLSKLSKTRLYGLADGGYLILNCQHRAEYTCTPKSYTLTRKDTDGSILQQNKNLSYNDSIPLYKGKTPNKDNYVFLGWGGGNGEFTVSEDIVYNAIFGDKGVEVPIYHSGCYEKRTGARTKCSLEYSGTTYLNLPSEMIKDGWYFMGGDKATSNSSNNDNPNNNSSSNNDSSTNNNSSSNNDSSSNSSSSNSSSSNDNSSNNSSSDDSSSNNSSGDDGSSSDSSNNSKNCVNIDVDDGNSYNFCIVKWKSNDSKFSVKVDNAKDLSLCTVGKGGQNYDFYNCEGDISSMGSSGISQLRLSIKYNNKTYSKKVDYDLTNGVFVEN